MGKINRGILGGFTGKVGNVVGSSWKGIETMRALPISVLNPRTTAQVGNRTRFGDISTLAASMLTTIVKPLNDRFASKMSGYNMFTSRCKGAFDADGIFVPAELVLSTGKLGETAHTSTGIENGTDVTINYEPTPTGSYQMTSDKAFVCVVTDEGVVIGVSSGVRLRDNGDITVVCSEELKGGVGYFSYLSFLRADGTIVGTSTRATVTVQP